MPGITDAAASAELHERLQAFIGQGGHAIIPTREQITLEGVRLITDISGDRNPVYSDPDFARSSIHGGLVAPPMSVLSWSLKNFRPVESADRVDEQGVRRYRLDPNPAREEGATEEGPYGVLAEVLQTLADAGYTSPAVTGGEYTFVRYPRVGDRLSFVEPVIESIVGPKVTALGEGYFVTQFQKILDQNGGEIGVMRHSSISFKPPA